MAETSPQDHTDGLNVPGDFNAQESEHVVRNGAANEADERTSNELLDTGQAQDSKKSNRKGKIRKA